MRKDKIEYRHLREADKQALVKELIWRAEPVSDSYTTIPIQHTLKDFFPDQLNEILEKTIEHIICKPHEKEGLLEYLRATKEQLMDRHQRNKINTKS